MKIAIPILTLGFALNSYGSLTEILYDHIGSTAPTTEGWTLASLLGGTNVGPIIDGGTPAWSIVNNTPGATGFYSVVPTGAEISAAATLGWSLQTTLRVTSPALTPGGSMLSLYRDGTRSYQMHFGSAANGDTIVVLTDGLGGFDSTTGASLTVPGGGAYNTFELIYSPSAGSADLFVNGVERLSNYTGFALSQTLLAWGDGSTRDLAPRINNSAGNYTEVIFSIVPEPTTALFGLALCGVAAIRRRR